MDKTLYQIRMEYGDLLNQHWYDQEFLSFPWLFNAAFLLVLYVVWIKLVDKKRLKELLLFGSLIAVAACMIDTIGVTNGLWEYPVRFLPISPSLFPFDFTVVPIIYMLVMQYTSSWPGYLLGSLIAAAVNVFGVNFVYIQLGILKYHNFSYFYMFLTVFIVTTLLKIIYNWIDSIQRKRLLKHHRA